MDKQETVYGVILRRDDGQTNNQNCRYELKEYYIYLDIQLCADLER